jgi:hypothetical protein
MIESPDDANEWCKLTKWYSLESAAHKIILFFALVHRGNPKHLFERRCCELNWSVMND